MTNWEPKIDTMCHGHADKVMPDGRIERHLGGRLFMLNYTYKVKKILEIRRQPTTMQ